MASVLDAIIGFQQRGQQKQQREQQQQQQAQQQAALSQLAQQLGLNLPTNTPPGLTQSLITSTLARQQGQPGFTLSPGQERFGPDGQAIAQVAVSDLEKQQIRSVINKNRAESEKTLREAKGQLTPVQKNAQTTGFRKEFNALSKDFRTSRDAFERVIASADAPSSAGDMALIFNFMKVLDPGSVVRESEFANAAASGSLGEKTKAAMAKISKGERLSPVMRKDFVNRAKRLFASQEKIQGNLIRRYTNLSKRFGVDPQDVVTESQQQQQGTNEQFTPQQVEAELKRRGVQ